MKANKAPPRRVRTIRFAEHEWRLIAARAAETGFEPSSWVREVSVRQARRELARTDPGNA